MGYSIAVTGGNAAGLSAAMEAKRTDPSVSVTVFEKSSHVSYGACSMPYFVAGMIDDYRKLYARKPDYFSNAGITLKRNAEVTSIDLKNRTLNIRENGAEYEHKYDRLVISTGSIPRKLPFETENFSNMFHFTTLDDAINLKEFIDTEKPGKAVIIGGGYIGIELADVFSGIDIETDLVEAFSILSAYDRDIMESVFQKMKTVEKLKIHEGIGVKNIKSTDGKVTSVVLENGLELECELLIVSAGILPNVSLAEKAGIQIGKTGAIKVNQKMQTSAYNVFACGDCAEIHHLILDEPVYVPLGTNANRTGKIVGKNIINTSSDVRILGSSMLRVFGLEAGGTGLTEKIAKKKGMNIETHMDTFGLKPGYFSKNSVTLKYVTDKYTKQLLGAQAVGDAEIHGIINGLAAIIYNRMKVDEIENIDMGYHPLLSGVWDPIILMARKCGK